MDAKTILNQTQFWDAEAEEEFKEKGILPNCALQNKAEILQLCQWMADQKIRSYMEIGLWTGKLVSALDSIFNFEKLAGCDLKECLSLGYEFDVPKNLELYDGNVLSPIYQNWRARLGEVDLIFLDADHSYEAVKATHEINLKFPARYFAFHGISGSERVGPGVKKFWDELTGPKYEIILPHDEIGSKQPTMGIGILTNPSQ